MRKTPYSCTCGRCASNDRGAAPYAVNLSEAARQNDAFRSALWTGRYLQTTLMSIPVSGDVGAEMHEDTDQMLRVEAGQGVVFFGDCPERLTPRWSLVAGDAAFVPAGVWHNVVNTGTCPLKLSSVYAPPHHPRCTLQQTKADAEEP